MKHEKIFSTKRTLVGFLAIAAITAMLLSVIGCAQETKPAHPPVVNTAHSPQFYITSLRTAGAQVIRLGETYRIVMPSRRLFQPGSAAFRATSPRMLTSVAGLLNAYHIVSVRVAAYSDTRHAGPRKNAFVQKQASAVQAYLSDWGIKARLIYADGQGSQHAVAWNGSASGRYANRRIEVSFQYIPKTTIYG